MSDEDLSQVLLDRRRKLEGLRAAGIDPFPHAYPGVQPIADVKAPFADLPDGEETDVRARIAGRLAARRGQGKAAFLDVVDRSGRMQLHARVDVLGAEAMERLLALDLGDLIGADGTVFRTRRGELSLRVDDFALLAKSLRPPPDKHHGLADVETRHRHRELDLIASEEARALFITRAKVIAAVRRFLDDAGFVEVETPILQPLYGGAAARPFVTHHNQLDRDLYLRIATELYLKRLIVGGLERVYELGKDFRNEGVSFKHNPEFTVLEWYEAYADYDDVARRCEALVASVAEAVGYDGRAGLLDAVAARDARRGDRRPRGRRHPREPRPRVAPRRDARAGPRGARERDDLGPARRPPAVEVRRAGADPAHVPHSTTPWRSRRSRSAIAPSPGLPSGGRRSRPGWSSPTRSPSSTTPTTSAPASSTSGATPRRATRRPIPWMRPTWPRWSRGCRRRAGSGSGSTGW